MSQKAYQCASLGGKTALVTGANRGIGAHLSNFLDAAGVQVVAAARRVESLQALPGVAAGRVLPVAMDVTDAASVAAGVAAAVARFGRLDALVNNAGIAWGGRALGMPLNEWDRVVATNLNGAFYAAQAAAQAMAAQDPPGGTIVSTASILGFGTGMGVAAYAATKAGLVHLTRSLALEWARHGIRVNALAPGYFPTDMTDGFIDSEAGRAALQAIPMRRFGQLQDLEGPLAFLMSDASAYVTGVVLPVDGGHLCRPL